MGMFDWINYKCNCPKCGKEVTGFQSKDGPCELKNLPSRAVNNLYSSCDDCNVWIELTVEYPEVDKEGVEMEIEDA